MSQNTENSNENKNKGLSTGAAALISVKYLLMKCPTALTSDDNLERLCPWNPECKDNVFRASNDHEKNKMGLSL